MLIISTSCKWCLSQLIVPAGHRCRLSKLVTGVYCLILVAGVCLILVAGVDSLNWLQVLIVSTGCR